MNKYNFRIYGMEENTGYKLIEITTNEQKAISYANNSNYQRVLIIRHNIELNMDEPISLTFPDRPFVRTKKNRR